MSNKYLLSVIIPTYNRAQLLDYTLRSLELQTLPRNKFEVIVSDDGSNDNTKEIADSYKEKLNIKYVFQEDKGYRPASARNNGILASRGETCLFLDSGVLADEHCLEAHVRLQRSAESPVAELGYVYGFDQEGADGEILETMINVDQPSDTIRQFQQKKFCSDVREPHYQKYNDKVEDMPAPWIFFWTCHVAVQRQYLLEIGLFDEKYDGNWGCEDNDVALRLLQQGIKIVLNRQATSIHYPHDKDMTQKSVQGYANCRYLHKKFNTPETGIFLENYFKILSNEFIDINELIQSAVLAK